MSEKNAVGWREWVAALRGLGNKVYVQGKGYLQSKDGFCCWGVACDLVDPSGWNGPEDFSKGPLGYKDHVSKTNRDGVYLVCFPPMRVKMALGVEKLSDIKYAGMNDRGATFLEIADEIEKEMNDDSE